MYKIFVTTANNSVQSLCGSLQPAKVIRHCNAAQLPIECPCKLRIKVALRQRLSRGIDIEKVDRKTEMWMKRR